MIRINKLIWGVTAFLLLSGFAAGAEDVPVLYAPPSDGSAHAEVEKTQTLVSPKFVDDADLNFDEIALEDFNEESEAAETGSEEKTETEPVAENNLPVLQKNSEDVLPSNKHEEVFVPGAVPARPVDAPALTGNNGKSLTETIQAKTADSAEPQNVPAEEKKEEGEETWLNKIKGPIKSIGSSVVSGGGSNLENLVESSKKSRSRSNASVFDISGLMLRMSQAQVEEIMKKRGFQKVYQKFDIPNFIRWRNEDTCRNHGVVGYERLESCVVETAKKDKHQYVSLTKYSKFSTKEEIEVRFTSNFTNNKVYKITYKSMASAITGNSQKAIYLRNIKIYDFWKKVNQKYGAPDNRDDVVWGLGGNKPYMQAATGMLVLEDPMLRELDYTRMSREDQKFMNTGIYSF